MEGILRSDLAIFPDNYAKIDNNGIVLWRCCQVRIVFIGDSITESGKFEDTEALGTGYVRLLYDYFITAYPANDFEVINKGISGNRNLDSIGNQKLKPYVEIVNTMAEKYDAYLVPTHQAFLSIWKQIM